MRALANGLSLAFSIDLAPKLTVVEPPAKVPPARKPPLVKPPMAVAAGVELPPKVVFDAAATAGAGDDALEKPRPNFSLASF